MIQGDNVSPLALHKLRKLPGGLGESSHLSNAYLTEPERMDSVLAFAFGTQNESVLSALTGGIGNVRVVENREYKWDLHGQSERVVDVVENHVGGSTTPGLGGTTFKLKLAEPFSVTDVISSNNGTQLLVQKVYQDGADYVHVVELVNRDNTTFIAPAQVDKGARFSKAYSIVGEMSDKGGGVTFQAPMTLTNQLTTLRMTYQVSRSAATDVMVIELYSPDGKPTKYWTKLVEWTSIAQWYKEKDRAMLYSQHNRLGSDYAQLKAENGRPIYTGAGLRQQISPANVRYYTKLTYSLLENFLMDLSYAANRWGGNHKFVALTGKMGMIEFNRAIRAELPNLPIAISNGASFISGSGMNMTFGGGFTTVKFLNGIELTVKEFSPYDDFQINRELHPVSKKPIESYRFTILNFGTTGNGRANIRKVVKKNSENAMWYVAGSTGPTGDVAKSLNIMRSSGIDGYEVHFLTEEGIQLEDPTSCGELILNVA